MQISTLKKQWPIIALACVFAVVYAAMSILRHYHFRSSGYDLGIFDQAVWHYSRFEAPASTTRGVANLLGDHFHPILISLAPLYWLYGNVNVLLIAQGILFALAIIPIWLFTNKRLGGFAAYCFSISYAIFWGVQNAVAFDFHEIAFAIPLIAFAIYFIDLKKWKQYFICITLLLLVKEDMSVLVAFMGVFLLTQKHLKQGIASIISGTIWFFLATKLFIPFFSGQSGAYVYWTYTQFGPDPISSIWAILKNPLLVAEVLFQPRTKLKTGFSIFYPFGFLAFFSPLIILAIPLISERFLSSNIIYWVRDFHYTATIAPILAMASADGLYNLTRVLKQNSLKKYVIFAVSLAVLFMNLLLLPKYPLWNLTKPGNYSSAASDIAGIEAIATIPLGASVTAQDGIIPHLSERQVIYQLKPGSPETDYLIASDKISPWPNGSFAEIQNILITKTHEGYETIYHRSGWVVLSRKHQD